MRELTDFDMPTAIVQEGVFYWAEKPVYFIEYLSEGGLYDSVTVYEAEQKHDGSVGKAQVREVTPPKKLGESILTRLLGGQPKQSNRVKMENKPPLFVAPVVEGTNSFKGADELGFYDREPDKIRVTSKQGVEEGERTGVFIGLSSIRWHRTYYPSEDILARFLAEQQLWSGNYDTEFREGY